MVSPPCWGAGVYECDPASVMLASGGPFYVLRPMPPLLLIALHMAGET